MIQSNPMIMSSLPMSLTARVCLVFPNDVVNVAVTDSLIPPLIAVPSALYIGLAASKVLVVNLYCLTMLGCIKHPVDPVSNKAFPLKIAFRCVSMISMSA